MGAVGGIRTAMWKAGLLAIAWLCLPGTAEGQLTERLYQDACDSGDTNACIVFGLMSELGNGVERDPVRARNLYRRACEGGDLVGCTDFGLMLEEGRGGPRDTAEARGRYEVACEGDEPLACSLLATLDEMAADDGETTYLKRGRSADAATGTPLSNTLIELPELDAHAVSDGRGLVALGPLPQGTYRLTAKRLGYLDLEGELQVPGSAEFVVLLDRADEPDPEAPGSIFGRVTDARSGAISDVEVSIVGQERIRTLSDDRGRFGLTGIEPGLIRVRVTRLGYAPRTATLVVQPGRTADLAAVLEPEAFELEPIEVTVRSRFLERNGYYERALGAMGHHLAGEELQRQMIFQPSDAIVRMPGLRLSDPRNFPGEPQYVINPRVHTWALGDCVLDVYIDGIRQASPDVNQLSASDVDAMEVYLGAQTPARYTTLNPCGIVLLWTRR